MSSIRVCCSHRGVASILVEPLGSSIDSEVRTRSYLVRRAIEQSMRSWMCDLEDLVRIPCYSTQPCCKTDSCRPGRDHRHSRKQLGNEKNDDICHHLRRIRYSLCPDNPTVKSRDLNLLLDDLGGRNNVSSWHERQSLHL